MDCKRATVIGLVGLATLLARLPGAWALPAGIVPPLGPIGDPSALCAAALNLAEGVVHTPAGLLNAVATVESGQRDPQTGQVAPWPWTIDANGTGHIYATEAQAVAAAQSFENQGITSLDIGCMQINLLHHPTAFATLAQAFDPASNALYGAQFLRRLKTRLGGWDPAVAAYHSETPALGLPYEQKVLAVWHDHGGPAPVLLPVAAGMAGIPKPAKADAKPAPGAIALRQFGVGGFAFAGLHGHPQILPIAAPGGAAPAGGMVGRGLAAYRRNPIPITGAK
ncbi:transglycosylase SLT domain-containing protein [Acidiphilium sp. PA]|uniref:transglycosylase SLT domain-containing protein n=1 Tax=Acidiphilium sp. PA TaxID=2871705 RepID=UPI002242EBDC|nr:transglycosylase SLT domain-containing protein [Acidiphilium sp. PA]MCW8306910.1 transglycosylase SLT domain-containing protein [Acidiphilium sp. PA]